MAHGVGRRRWCARCATAGMIRMTWLALARGPLGTGADADVALCVRRASCAHGRISALLVGVAKVVAANALGLAFLTSKISCMRPRMLTEHSTKHRCGACRIVQIRWLAADACLPGSQMRHVVELLATLNDPGEHALQVTFVRSVISL